MVTTPVQLFRHQSTGPGLKSEPLPSASQSLNASYAQRAMAGGQPKPGGRRNPRRGGGAQGRGFRFETRSLMSATLIGSDIHAMSLVGGHTKTPFA